MKERKVDRKRRPTNTWNTPMVLKTRF